LRVRPSALRDFELILEACAERFPSLMPAIVFSISFGSWLAIELAAKRPDLVGELITFGGYREFDAIARFCVCGEVEHQGEKLIWPRDPLDSRALFLNLLDGLEVREERAELAHAFRRMCYRTWGRMELKAEGKLIPIVDDMLHLAPSRHRELFRIVAGAEPDTVSLLGEALSNRKGNIPNADPDRALRPLTAPYTTAHPRERDGTPCSRAYKLRRALPEGEPPRLHLTGRYTHSGRARGAEREVWTLIDLARALAYAGSRGEPQRPVGRSDV